MFAASSCVACSQEEIPRLRDLYDRGQRNGLRGLAWLNPDQMREIEPHVAGVAAVRVPEEGIVDYPAVCRTLQKLIVASGGEVLTGTPVEDLCRTQAGWAVNGRPARFLVNRLGCTAIGCLHFPGSNEARGSSRSGANIIS